jgi:hypothetical protein
MQNEHQINLITCNMLSKETKDHFKRFQMVFPHGEDKHNQEIRYQIITIDDELQFFFQEVQFKEKNTYKTVHHLMKI